MSKNLSDDQILLNFLIRTEQNQSDLYKPTKYWKENTLRTKKYLEKFGLNKFRSVPQISKGFSDVIVENPMDAHAGKSFKEFILLKIHKNKFIQKFLLEPYLKKISKLNSQTLDYQNKLFQIHYGKWLEKFLKNKKSIDTLIGEPSLKFKINNKFYPTTYFNSFLRIDKISKIIDLKKIRNIFEIGGGFGSLSHSLLHFYPNIHKLYYLDIVPNIYIGNQYLKKIFSKRVINYSQCSDQKKLVTDKKKVIFTIPPWGIEKIPSEVDLFLNFSSFQEMEENVILNYLKFLRKILKKHSVLCFGIKGSKEIKNWVLKRIRSFFGKEFSIIENSSLANEQIYFFRNSHS